MLQLIKKIFSKSEKGKDSKKTVKIGDSLWARKQLGEMGKLGGKLILM